MKVVLKKNFPIILFLSIFILGLKISDNYGVNGDDTIHQWIGSIFYSYFINILSFNFENQFKYQIIDLSEHKHFWAWLGYSFFFEFISNSINNLLNIQDLREIYLLRNKITFIFFFLSSIFLFKIILLRFKNYFFSYLAVLFFYLCPRIFGESFFNNKDILFLSITIINLYYSYKFLENQKITNLILFSIIAGILINIRIIGIIFPMIIYLIIVFENCEKKIFNHILKVIFSLTIICIIYLIFSPYLWIDFINNLKKNFFFISIAANKTIFITEYFGEYIPSTFTPWEFRLVWIFITIPEILNILFVSGFLYFTFYFYNRLIFIEKKKKLWNNQNQKFDIYIFIITLIFFSFLIFVKNKFNGWRHFYFIYPLIIYFGIFFLYKTSKFKKLIKNLIYFLILLNLLKNTFTLIQFHPYQYVNLNYIHKYFIKKNFETDYFGVALKHDLEFILNHDNRKLISVSSLGALSLGIQSKILEKEKLKRFFFISFSDEKEKKADYLINNYHKAFTKNEKVDLEIYTKIRDLKVDNILISTIYKKKGI